MSGFTGQGMREVVRGVFVSSDDDAEAIRELQRLQRELAYSGARDRDTQMQVARLGNAIATLRRRMSGAPGRI